MPRKSKYHKRQYVYECSRCHVWFPVLTLTAQRFARARGTCMACTDDPQWRTRVYLRLCALHLEDITKRASSLPEHKRAVYRALYRKRQATYLRIKQQLEEVPV